MHGKGVVVDYAVAMQLARRSADQGNVIGECNVGALYAFGWGVPRDLRTATMWYIKAATHGDEDAKERLLDLAAAGVPEAAAAVRRLRLAR
jgi:TPR repeat protein